MIWALVLAAGESRRMGRPKLLLPFRGTTVIETLLGCLLASKVDRVLVVLGAAAPQIREKIKRFPVETVFNRRFRRGMLSSVQCGLAALPGSVRAAAIVLGDQPAIPVAIVDSLIDAYKRTKKGIVVPVFRGARGHPLLLDLRFRPEVMTLDPAVGLRQLLTRHPDEICEVRISSPGVLSDIDNPADYLAALKIGQARKRRHHDIGDEGTISGNGWQGVSPRPPGDRGKRRGSWARKPVED
jgi:molybdenum cofactor cytidylyltransferase